MYCINVGLTITHDSTDSCKNQTWYLTWYMLFHVGMVHDRGNRPRSWETHDLKRNINFSHAPERNLSKVEFIKSLL